jgi:hypothetical protein
MSHAYIPIAVMMWTEYAPQQANLRTELYLEFSQDSWAKDIVDDYLKMVKETLEKRNIKFKQ